MLYVGNMKQDRILHFLYGIVIIASISLLAVGYHNRTTDKNQNITPYISRDLENLTDQDLANGQFRINSEAPVKYFLSESYHKNYFPSSRIWSSVPASGNLTGSYFYPYAVKSLDGDLIIDIPRTKVGETFVLSDISADGLRISTDQRVTEVYLKDFSDLMVRFEMRNGDTVLYEAVMAQGLPFIYLYPKAASGFDINQGRFELTNEDNQQDLGFSYENNLIAIGNVDSWSQNVRTIETQQNSENPLILGFYQGDNEQSIRDGFDTEIANIWADYIVEDGKAKTIYSLTDENDKIIDKPIPFGFLPHHGRWQDNTTPLYSLQTIRGEQDFYATDTFTVETPLEELNKELLFDIPSEDKDLIAAQLKKDIEELEIESTSAYFGNKSLARAARLIELARVLDEKSLAFMAETKLKEQLEIWLNDDGVRSKQYFEWDTSRGGIIAHQTGFGNEEYNDHHFHYGYFLHSAAVIAENDPEFLEQYKQNIDIIAYDIANVDREFTDFPYVRTFDFYEGHSWAAGYQPFADGNNQESTSEAVNAWYGLWRWGEASSNDNFVEAARYLYTQETNAARYYWLNGIEGRDAFPVGYGQNTASIIFGGKIEYATFFSPDPLAIEGIQFIPITPGSTYLYDQDRIERDFDFFRERDLSLTEGPLVDMHVGYYAMIEGWDVLSREEIAELPIDDGNTLSNLYYWISYWDAQK